MTVLTRILCTLVALVLLLGGLLGAVEIVLALLGQPAWLVPHGAVAAWLRQQSWDSSLVRLILAALALLGLLLLVAALRRGRPRTLTLPARPGQTPSGVTVSASRRGAEAWLEAAARRTNGVRGADVRLRRRRAKVTVRTANRSHGNLGADVTDVVRDRLAALGADSRIRPRVTVSLKEAR
jgi:hypothetical protein